MSNLDDFSAIHNNTDMSDALARLREALAQARTSQAIDAETEEAAQSYLRQAIREVNMPAPSKETLIDHLDSAKDCLTGRPAVSSIVEALTQAATTAQTLF